PGVRGKHRRLQQCFGHVLQRVSAGQGPSRQPVMLPARSLKNQEATGMTHPLTPALSPNGAREKHRGLSIFFFVFIVSSVLAADRPRTFCNPMDLDYRFQLNKAGVREAADPAAIYFEKEYWLFASKSGGYWHSPDFREWTFVDGKQLPIEPYAPAVA